ncbi:MAG: F0F1 ATP synthase subunit B [Clostridioides sp.]|jgi:F-type H+-transporting ATPase subunit b|nr:F0F1 ATP synthase subunit B [Clostridioides sp.]
MELKPFVTLSYEYIFQIANTLILFFVFKKLLYKPVMNIIKQREDEINNIRTEAEKSREEGSALKKEYEEKVSIAKREGQEIIQQATLRAQTKSDEIITEAKEEALSLKEKANKDIEREKQNAMNDLKSTVSEIALLAAAKVIEKDIDREKHEQLIHDFINEVGEAK